MTTLALNLASFSAKCLDSETFGSPSSSASSQLDSGPEGIRSPSLESVSSIASELKSLSTSDLLNPLTFIYLQNESLSALSSLYDEYAVQGLIGLCVGDSIPNNEWMKTAQWKLAQKGTVMYLISSEAVMDSFNADQLPQTHAEHLLAFSLAGLRSIFSSTVGSYTAYILERPAVVFPPLSHTPSFKPACLLSQTDNAKPNVCNIPTLEEWRTLWSAWDLVTLQMIPSEMLHQKPIDLRHKCLFYIGHIPTFLDMLLSKAIGGEATEPKFFWNIFERGIDPRVDDPDHCHSHSEVPEKDQDWPTIETIMEFRDGVRARLANLYEDLDTGKRKLTRNIARTLVMTLEHEGFHIETLLYMLLQRAGTGTLPPPGFTIPPWVTLARQWNQTPAPSTPSVVLGPADIVMGHDDSEGDDFIEGVMYDVDHHEYGWDNESPARTVHVGAFRAEWRPVSNDDFETFWRAGQVSLPKSWAEEDGELKVRTMYGLVPMDIARHWPVLTSYDDLAAYACSKDGRIPTEPELRLFLDTYDVGFAGGSNIGFRNWHPIPATTGLDQNQGRGSNGGVWEWTSTLFDNHEGLVPTNLFTGYSTDFFDTKHQVVLGASYATIPRLGRRTVRNFYQHNYPYPWVGARIVYDI